MRDYIHVVDLAARPPRRARAARRVRRRGGGQPRRGPRLLGARGDRGTEGRGQDDPAQVMPRRAGDAPAIWADASLARRSSAGRRRATSTRCAPTPGAGRRTTPRATARRRRQARRHDPDGRQDRPVPQAPTRAYVEISDFSSRTGPRARAAPDFLPIAGASARLRRAPSNSGGTTLPSNPSPRPEPAVAPLRSPHRTRPRRRPGISAKAASSSRSASFFLRAAATPPPRASRAPTKTAAVRTPRVQSASAPL